VPVYASLEGRQADPYSCYVDALVFEGDKNSRPGLYEFSTSFLDDIIKNGLGDELRTEVKITSK
jgi:hypothetical protein